MNTSKARLVEICQDIRLILSDVDGVLTDGGIIFDNNGIETKKFHVRDGLGIRLWQRAGHKFGLLTARPSHIVQVRADELGIDVVRQGFHDKLPVAEEMINQLELSTKQVCYIGDDLADLPVMRAVGMSVAVADAADDVTAGADHVTQRAGGNAAVREVIETILKAQNRWEDLIQRYR